ncbi:MAG: ferrous iron transport protein B [Burkholderiales bacterium]|jgi:ferrous iron transport protein B|nr:ferrous iron transport protein B [Burkholderiales bacterium]
MLIEHSAQKAPGYQIALIGNPNSGKTTLFNALTGSHQQTGNWPGVTVERKTGAYKFRAESCDAAKLAPEKAKEKVLYSVNVVDLPGTYAVESSQTHISQDELIARQFLLTEKKTLIINIVDAGNLQRNLYLTFQLLELGQPMIVALNMMDEVRRKGETIDVAALEARLGCRVVPIAASRNEGIDTLREVIHEVAASSARVIPKIATLTEQREAELFAFLQNISSTSELHRFSRWQLLDAVLLPENDHRYDEKTRTEIAACRQLIAQWGNGEIDIALASARYEAIDALCADLIQRPGQANPSLTAKIDRLALGRVAGVPVFLAMMYLMFFLAINVGAVFIDFFDILFGTIFVDGLNHLLTWMNMPQWVVAVGSNGLGGGIQTVSTFVPVIGAMFLCLSFLEDSGYLARAAVVVDRVMRGIGLPGKAFVPMLVGFGCNVPAIMGTRTLESPRDRLISIMMIPYMSCGARLPVYALLVAIFFPVNGQNVVFTLYIGGILIAVLTGLVLKHTLLKGAITPFIMELPPYRVPTLRNMLMLTWERLRSFMIRSGKVIVGMVIVLSFFNSLGSDGTFGNEDTDKSVLATVGKAITPVFSPMGITEDNWPATVGIFTGILAKESVIGTLNALYAQSGTAQNKALAEDTPDDEVADNPDSSEDVAASTDAPEEAETAEDEDEGYHPLAGIKEAFATIPENFGNLLSGLTDPLSISASLAPSDEPDTVAGVPTTTANNIRAAFGTSAAAFAFLIFVLLYTPCAAALGAVYREAGGKWMAMVALWALLLAWVFATAFYQASLVSVSPQAKLWLIGLSTGLVALFFVLRLFAHKEEKTLALPQTASGKDLPPCCR